MSYIYQTDKVGQQIINLHEKFYSSKWTKFEEMISTSLSYSLMATFLVFVVLAALIILLWWNTKNQIEKKT